MKKYVIRDRENKQVIATFTELEDAIEGKVADEEEGFFSEIVEVDDWVDVSNSAEVDSNGIVVG